MPNHPEMPPLPGCSVLPPLLTGEEKARRAAQQAKRRNGPKPKGSKVRGRFAVANAFADYGARRVDTTAQAVWWIIWRETKPDGLARVSFGRLAECVGATRRTAVRAVKRLENAGLLTVVRRGSLRQGASTYRAHGTPKG